MFLFLPKPVNGISLSTLQKNKYSQVRVGESTEFTVLFWNSEKSSFPVELSVESLSKNLSVFITPNKFTIEPSLVTELPAEAGKEYVDTRQGLMKATPVRIIVKPSDNAVLGEYDIYVKTIVGSPKLGISTLLERTFKFTVNVTSPPTFSEQLSKITGRISETVKDVSNKITGMVTTGPATNLVLLIIVIIVLAFVIWFIRFRK
jgi:hypothetical protein